MALHFDPAGGSPSPPSPLPRKAGGEGFKFSAAPDRRGDSYPGARWADPIVRARIPAGPDRAAPTEAPATPDPFRNAPAQLADGCAGGQVHVQDIRIGQIAGAGEKANWNRHGWAYRRGLRSRCSISGMRP